MIRATTAKSSVDSVTVRFVNIVRAENYFSGLKDGAFDLHR